MVFDKNKYMREYNRRYRRENPERVKRWKEIDRHARRTRIKYEVIEKFSKGTMKCKRCGFSDIRALSIDHIHGGGSKERRKYKNTNPNGYYIRMIREGSFEEYQVLCMNCQFIKRFENKEHN